MQHQLTLLTAPQRMPINNRPISKVKSLWLLLVPELPSCPAALVIGSITSTYIKLWLHCNHNHPSSVHMSAPIPLKTASLLETEWAVISLFTAKQPAMQQKAKETQH